MDNNFHFKIITSSTHGHETRVQKRNRIGKDNHITNKIMNATKKYLVPALLGLFMLHAPDCGVAASLYRANSHAKSLTTPVGGGAANNIVFMGVGGTMPATLCR
ncbi:hypothetical protein Cpha266_2638 [Chlorobium phaeobacteroides DSM 266]|uniref:Uncharacterized protein n=2 Tax=Chlorobium phaeobacteroides TaxID=1096 RepID=A1BJP5_CHLPD|nr:hypothetical protein Cpha266_2638 [Chlorobium phaeobacteroides DSM 266]